MSLVFVQPARAMGIGRNQLALYAPASADAGGAGGTSSALTALVSGTIGWWDASLPSGLSGLGSTPVTAWNSPGRALIDLTGNGHDLLPFTSPASSSAPQGSAHLSGLLGGAGFPTATAGLLQPALDPGAGWQQPASSASATSSWTWHLVWSRPNWRQGTSFDNNPITLLTVGSHPILQVDSSGGANRLVLFPGVGQVVVSTGITRRHTHSIVIRYSPASGADLWLDDNQVARSAAWSSSAPSGPVLLLHDGTIFGAAQCWFHEAAEWNRALSDADVSAVRLYAGRWARGVRKGLYLLFNGQSNAINYTLNDGAAALLARGIGWYLGALAYNVLATTGNPASYTMQSGHGIYAVASAGYPGSFLSDPGDGSDPSNWQLGADGLAVQHAVAGLAAEDLADFCSIVWPWNETDTLRQYSERATFQAAALHFLSLVRTMLGKLEKQDPAGLVECDTLWATGWHHDAPAGCSDCCINSSSECDYRQSADQRQQPARLIVESGDRSCHRWRLATPGHGGQSKAGHAGRPRCRTCAARGRIHRLDHRSPDRCTPGWRTVHRARLQAVTHDAHLSPSSTTQVTI